MKTFEKITIDFIVESTDKRYLMQEIKAVIDELYADFDFHELHFSYEPAETPASEIEEEDESETALAIFGA